LKGGGGAVSKRREERGSTGNWHLQEGPKESTNKKSKEPVGPGRKIARKGEIGLSNSLRELKAKEIHERREGESGRINQFEKAASKSDWKKGGKVGFFYY